MYNQVISKISLILSLLLYACSILAESKVTLVADRWWPVNGNPGEQHQGYMVDVAKAILSNNGYTVEYIEIPWKRALELTRIGTYDCTVGTDHSEGDGLVFPNLPLSYFTTNFYVRYDNKWTYKGLASLEDTTIGVINGYTYTPELDNYIATHASRVESVNGNNALIKNIQSLINGRIQVIIEFPPVMQSTLKLLNATDKVIDAGNVGSKTPIYIACSPQKNSSNAIVTQLDKGLQEMRNNGKLQEILDFYGLSDWEVGKN